MGWDVAEVLLYTTLSRGGFKASGELHPTFPLLEQLGCKSNPPLHYGREWLAILKHVEEGFNSFIFEAKDLNQWSMDTAKEIYLRHKKIEPCVCTLT